MFTRVLVILLLFLPFGSAQTGGSTVVGIRGSQFTINGKPSYTRTPGFPSRIRRNVAGTLLNVRAIQAIFDDANYPNEGSRLTRTSPIHSDQSWDYPDGPWDPRTERPRILHRDLGLAALRAAWRDSECTQRPPDGNYGERITLQPHNNSIDPNGSLKPAYAGRLRRVIAEADRLGMVVIVGFFYFGSNERIQITPDDRYVKEQSCKGAAFSRACRIATS